MLTPKPPRPFPAKPRRLPERKHMTIALGLIARDGIVFAADTQETTPGYWKHDQGKIWECGRALLETSRGGGAFCLVAGAGHAAHVDGISRALIHRFNAEPYLSDPAQVQPALALELEMFHAKYVLPFAAYPHEDRPSFQLIVGYKYTNGVGELLISEDNLLQRQSVYAAVGVGALLAKTLLGRWLQRSRELTRGCSREVDHADSSATRARQGQARFARHLR